MVDKYERGAGVLNVDALEYSPPEPCDDLIVSVSTLEHVGWDETERDPPRACAVGRGAGPAISPGGRHAARHPARWATTRCSTRPSAPGGVPSLYTLRALRRTARTAWEEAEPADVWDVRYDQLLCAANAVLVGTVDRME